MNQPIRLSSGLRESLSSQQQRQLQTNPAHVQQKQQQTQLHQQHLKQQQQQQRQLKQQQKNQQQLQYKTMNRSDRIMSAQHNRQTAVNSSTFGMENANRRANFRVSISHRCRRCIVCSGRWTWWRSNSVPYLWPPSSGSVEVAADYNTLRCCGRCWWISVLRRRRRCRFTNPAIIIRHVIIFSLYYIVACAVDNHCEIGI